MSTFRSIVMISLKILHSSEVKMEKRAAESESEAKRQKITESVFRLLNKDLTEWKSKLTKFATENPTSESKWKLVFFSQDQGWGEQNCLYSFGSPPSSEKEWKFEEYEFKVQNMGGKVIAYANLPAQLCPALCISERRLQLFGFVYVICPIDFKLPKSRQQLVDDFAAVTYGADEVRLHPRSRLLENLPIPKNFTGQVDLDDLDYMYALYDESRSRETKDLEEIDKEIERLQKQRADLKYLLKIKRGIIGPPATVKRESDSSEMKH